MARWFNSPEYKASCESPETDAEADIDRRRPTTLAGRTVLRSGHVLQHLERARLPSLNIGIPRSLRLRSGQRSRAPRDFVAAPAPVPASASSTYLVLDAEALKLRAAEVAGKGDRGDGALRVLST